MFIDSHVHFDGFVADGSFGSLIENARAAEVSGMVAVGGSPEANLLSRKLAEEHADLIVATAGYDRDLAAEGPDLSELRELVADPLVRAVGETGLDYYYVPETAPEQKRLFAENLALAAEFDKPAIVHSRDADEDTLAILADYVRDRRGNAGKAGVLHCFTRELPFARKVLDLGLYISFSGIVTFRNADMLREVAAYVPLDRMLIETDSPYLAPVPQRGKRNEPAFVVHVANELAKQKGCSLECVAKSTAENARALFSI